MTVLDTAIQWGSHFKSSFTIIYLFYYEVDVLQIDQTKNIRQASWLKITMKGNTGLEINATHCTNVSTKTLYNLFVFLIVALIGIFSCIIDWF